MQKMFLKKNKLKISHENSPSWETFFCSICKRAFRSKPTLNDHMRIHPVVLPFSCNTCKGVFRSKQAFINHKKTHEVMPPVHCDICKRSFSSKSSLEIHQRVHTAEQFLPAWFVEKAFFAYLCWVVTWKLTNKKTPSNFRPVGKSFTHKKKTQLSSTAHIRIHTGEKTLSLVNFVANVLIRFSHFRLYKAKKLYIVVPFELNENFWILI